MKRILLLLLSFEVRIVSFEECNLEVCFASELFGSSFLLKLAIACLAAVVHLFAVIGSENVTFPLLKVLPSSVSNSFATSGLR